MTCLARNCCRLDARLRVYLAEFSLMLAGSDPRAADRRAAPAAHLPSRWLAPESLRSKRQTFTAMTEMVRCCVCVFVCYTCAVNFLRSVLM